MAWKTAFAIPAGEFLHEERVAGGPGVDAADGVGTGRLAGFAADELGHLAGG